MKNQQINQTHPPRLKMLEREIAQVSKRRKNLLLDIIQEKWPKKLQMTFNSHQMELIQSSIEPLRQLSRLYLQKSFLKNRLSFLIKKPLSLLLLALGSPLEQTPKTPPKSSNLKLNLLKIKSLLSTIIIIPMVVDLRHSIIPHPPPQIMNSREIILRNRALLQKHNIVEDLLILHLRGRTLQIRGPGGVMFQR